MREEHKKRERERENQTVNKKKRGEKLRREDISVSDSDSFRFVSLLVASDDFPFAFAHFLLPLLFFSFFCSLERLENIEMLDGTGTKSGKEYRFCEHDEDRGKER